MDKDLKEHLKSQKKSEIKTNPQKEMTQRTREEAIKDMLSKQSLTVGATPFKSNYIESMMKKMMDKGVMSEDEPQHERMQRMIKSVLKSWCFKNLKMPDQEWNLIHIDEIQQTYSEDSCILFMKFRTQSDARKITERASNLPHDPTGQGPCLVTFIDKRAKARHNSIQQIARSIREESEN